MSTPREDTTYVSKIPKDEICGSLRMEREFDLRFATKGSSNEWRVTSSMLQIFKKSGNADRNSAAIAAKFQKLGILPRDLSRPSLDEAINADSDFRPDLASGYQPMEAAVRQEGGRIIQWRLDVDTTRQDDWEKAKIEGLAAYAQRTASASVMRAVQAEIHLFASDHPYSTAVDSALTFVEKRLETTAGATDEDLLARVRLLSLNILRHQRLATHLEALSSVVRAAITVGKECIVCNSLTIADSDDALMKGVLHQACESEAQVHTLWEQNLAIWDATAAEAGEGARVFLQHRSDVLAVFPPQFHEEYKKEIASMITRSSARELVSELATYQLLNDDPGDEPHPAAQLSGQKLSKSARRAARQKAKAASSTAIPKSSASGGIAGGRGLTNDTQWSSASAAIRRSVQKIDSTTIDASAPPSGPWEPVSSGRTRTRGAGTVEPLPKSLLRHDDGSEGSGVAPSSYSSYGDRFNEMFWKPVIIGGDRWWRQTDPDPEFQPAPLLAGPAPAPLTVTHLEDSGLSRDQEELRLRLREEQLQLQGTREDWAAARGWVAGTSEEHPQRTSTPDGSPHSEHKEMTEPSSLDDEMVSPLTCSSGSVALHSLPNLL